MGKAITPVVFTDEHGQHQIMTADGNILRVFLTRITDEVGEMPYALVKMHVHLATDQAAAEVIVKEQLREM